MMYRVFIGMWDDGEPDYTHLDQRALSWDEAKQLLADRLRRWETDTCEDCKKHAAEELARLLLAEPGRFDADVEGDDYLILEDR